MLRNSRRISRVLLSAADRLPPRAAAPSGPDPATLIGSGKVEEIAAIAASTNADLVLFDHDLTATQLRTLSRVAVPRARPHAIISTFLLARAHPRGTVASGTGAA